MFAWPICSWRSDGLSKERASRMLPPEAIAEYKTLYFKRFGINLSDAEASFRANNLIGLYKAVLGIGELNSESKQHDQD